MWRSGDFSGALRGKWGGAGERFIIREHTLSKTSEISECGQSRVQEDSRLGKGQG